MTEPILQVRDLKMHFPVKQSGNPFAKPTPLKAVDGVNLDVYPGETIGLVGESGCGKSTLGRTIMQLYKPTAGEVWFEGQKVQHGDRETLTNLRQNMQMIFQDPFSSLNPRMTVEDIVSEPLRTYNILKGKELRHKVQELLERVGMNPRYIRRYPHEFSGGQCQRIGIARALAINPKVIIADEPISALDVSIQAQILNLMEKLQEEMGLTYIFIAHDLAAVRHISDRIAVMYLGRIVEIAQGETIMKAPKHPYTQALISAVPIPNPELERKRERIVLQGDVPSALKPPQGCTFHTRCFKMQEDCKINPPQLETIEANHEVSCFYPGSAIEKDILPTV
jgi:oligopeptide transport system ATP-binding protein